MTNKLFEKNKNNMRKKVFVKEKIKMPVKSGRFTCNIERTSKPSLLANFLGKSKKNDDGFMIQPPHDNDPNSIKTTIYFFSMPRYFEIQVSKKNKVYDVVRHIITLY
jgi:hypothetical protein